MKKVLILFCMFGFLFLFSCQKEEEKDEGKNEVQVENTQKEALNIAVFLPGIRKDSPIYDMLAHGVEKAVQDAKTEGKAVEVMVMEAGTNQRQWVEKLSNLANEKKWDLIISSNPAMPSIVKDVLERFPENNFLLLDAYCDDDARITTAKYNQYEQAYIAGYMAALVSTSDMQHANKLKKIGLISGQEYPDMSRIILPSFERGAKAFDAEIEVDFRIVGNWYDASKGAELASSMYADGVDVIMPICGGASQGVLASAKENNFYVLWFDNNGYNKAEGLVVGSSILEQEKLAYEKTTSFIKGELKRGVPDVLGMKEGYIKFITDDPLYISTVPQELRDAQEVMLKSIATGAIDPSK